MHVLLVHKQGGAALGQFNSQLARAPIGPWHQRPRRPRVSNAYVPLEQTSSTCGRWFPKRGWPTRWAGGPRRPQGETRIVVQAVRNRKDGAGDAGREWVGRWSPKSCPNQPQSRPPRPPLSRCAATISASRAPAHLGDALHDVDTPALILDLDGERGRRGPA